MDETLRQTLGRIAAGKDLSAEDMESAIESMLAGKADDAEIGLFLTGLRLKGETVDEVVGAARALRRRMTPIRSSRIGLLDTCGTGGDDAGTFNISTAAALVAAPSGAAVAKHGNRRATSRSGSADVLAELGVNIEAETAVVERCLDELGIGFCFAPLVHGAMKQVAGVRRRLETATIFNLLGPLANPAQAPFQLIGVGRDEHRSLLAQALAKLGTRRSAIVHGEDGLDEVTLAGDTRVTIVTGDRINELRWRPEDFGLSHVDRETLLAADPAASAAMIREALAGAAGGPREIVSANAAAALWLCGRAESLKQGVAQAAEAIDRGAASALLERLVEMTRARG